MSWRICILGSIMLFLAAGPPQAQSPAPPQTQPQPQPQAADFTVKDLQLDRIEWGIRTLTIKTDNPRDDTARLHVVIYSLYTDHYMSGLDRFDVDTNFVVPPHQSPVIKLSFEMPGSFGRIVTRAFVYWQFPQAGEGQKTSDSTFKTFSSVFIPKDEALQYSDSKHSLGPVYSIIDYPTLNFEFPRLILFLLSRGGTLWDIQELFIVEDGYTQLIYHRLREQGFFPLPGDTLSPGILAVTEPEAYKLRVRTQAAIETFAAWYAGGGGKGLMEIMRKAGLKDSLVVLPSLQLKILMTLLEKGWVNLPQGFDVSHFEKISADLALQNRPRWIVAGGEFFLPRLCGAAFEQNKMLLLSSFSPNPQLPYDKAPIYDIRKRAETAADSIPTIKVGQLRKAVAEAEKKGLLNDLAPKLKQVVLEAQGDLEKCQPYQMPYLADYIYSVVLGGYFVKHQPEGRFDCVQVKY